MMKEFDWEIKFKILKLIMIILFFIRERLQTRPSLADSVL